MRKVILVLIILLLFVHCKEKSEKQYYSDGNLRSEFFLSNGEYEGVFKRYYKSGELQELHNYSNGVKVDSSLFFTKNGILNYIDYYNFKDSISTYRKYFYEDGALKSEGLMYKSDFAVGYWNFYDEKKGFLKEIREIKNIAYKQHLNQSWQLNIKGDTIYEKSAYASFLFFKDTINLGEAVKVYAVQEEPFFKDKSSSIMAIVPRDYSEDFNEYFSNIEEIDSDTTYNLNVDKEYRTAGNLPNGDYALEIVFGRYYNTPGDKKFRGILVEYCDSDSLNFDSSQRLEHKIYFEKDIHVKDTL